MLVELQFSPNGRYDLTIGPFRSNELRSCAHLLLNGRNASIVTAFAPGSLITKSSTASFLIGCQGCVHTHVLDFVFDTAEPATTMGTVSAIIRDPGTGKLAGLNISVAPHHAAWEDNSTVIQPTTADGAFAVFGSPQTGSGAHYGGWPGATTTLCGAEHICAWVNMSTCPHDDLGKPTCSNMTVGQHVGLARGFSVGAAQFESTNVAVIQGVRSIGMGSIITLYAGGANVDVIDVHVDRLHPSPMFVWNDAHGFPAQSDKVGRFRIWHSSFEGGSDDTLNDNFRNADVAGIDRSTNSVLTMCLHGRFAEPGNSDGICGSGLQAMAGQTVEVGHADDPFAPFVTLTLASASVHQMDPATGETCGWNLTFVETLPAALNVTDLMSLRGAVRLHVKNVRAGNHEYNLFNVKGDDLTFEVHLLWTPSAAATRCVPHHVAA